MFISVQSKEKDKLDKIFFKIKKLLGKVPPHFELLGNIDYNALQNFLNYIYKLQTHHSINPDYFGFLRLYIANKEGFTYCVEFNTKLLINKNYKIKIINKAKSDLSEIPFDDKHKLLAIKSIKAIFDSKNFTELDFDKLYKIGWNDKDIYISIEHAGLMETASNFV